MPDLGKLRQENGCWMRIIKGVKVMIESEMSYAYVDTEL